jgi:protein-S-isoprenylcysteine O-methyltransferase Ste14
MTEANSKVVSVVAFLLAVCGIGFLLLTRSLFSSNPISITVQVGAFMLMIWARKTLGLRSFHASAEPTSGALITNGPYQWWRHPLYAAIIYFVLAGYCHNSLYNHPSPRA